MVLKNIGIQYLRAICALVVYFSHFFKGVNDSKIIAFYHSRWSFLVDGSIAVIFEDSAYYDLFSLPLLGTENIILYSDGYEKSRFEKTEFLTGIDKTKDVLSVCWRDIDNCSECPKCIRTLAALDLLEKLDEYSRVFDINKYRENKDWHWAKILSLSKTDPYYKELTTMAMEKNMVFSLKTRLLSMVFTFGRRVFNPNLLSRIQSIVRK